MNELEAKMEELSRAAVLLAACDYDGTLAPIAPEPSKARPVREGLVALKALASLPHTHVAVISGRALQDLAEHTSEAAPVVHLVGSHGSEFDPGFAEQLSAEARALYQTLAEDLARLAKTNAGFSVEKKPAALAFHYRNAEETAAQSALGAITSGPAARPGVFVRHGKKVVELSVVENNKGRALQHIRQRLSASAVVYFGDDATDEEVFATLSGPDVGVKVGVGPSAAKYRVDEPADAARMLAILAERRGDWLAGGDAVPIDHHAMLSDQRAMALITPVGRLVWLCLPRIDSAAVFAELLGGKNAGFFEIAPADGGRPDRHRYIGDTFIHETQWPGFVVTDYLDCSGGKPFQRAGRSELIRVIEGRGRVRVTFSPRLDFGRTATRLNVADGGVSVEGALDPFVLHASGVDWQIVDEGRHQTAVAEFDLSGAPVVLEMRYGTRNMSPAVTSEAQRRQSTAGFWTSWSQSLALPAFEPELVRRSALALKALCYGPTGAIAAAATTSLPECVGGVRNWDYRFCWPRDAAMSAAALVRLGSSGIAMRFLDWVLGILDRQESSPGLRPVYTVTGGMLGPEADISDLPGYRGSRPVRLGNAAAQQVQIDVFGPIADLVGLLAENHAPLSADHERLLEMMVQAVEARWKEPDHGIWEVRSARKHYVYSKVMCWFTIDRALTAARYLGRHRDDWVQLRDRIGAEVLQLGWKSEVNSFGAAYEDVAPDAATLWVGLSGLLPHDDPRFRGTVERVQQSLTWGPTLRRYDADDNLPGREGAFLLCHAWLIETMCLMGRRDEALGLFRQYASMIGPRGLFAEEYDPEAGMALGNYPQAYSHVGLINAAVRLSRMGLTGKVL